MDESQDRNEREERLTHAVSRVLRIDDITWGDDKLKYIVRYRGRLYTEDTTDAYDRLAEELKPLGVTTLFRNDGNQHAVILMQGVVKAKKSRPWVNLIVGASPKSAGGVEKLQPTIVVGEDPRDAAIVHEGVSVVLEDVPVQGQGRALVRG